MDASRSSRPSSTNCMTMYANAALVSDAPYITVSACRGAPAAFRSPCARTCTTWPSLITTRPSPRAPVSRITSRSSVSITSAVRAGWATATAGADNQQCEEQASNHQNR